MKKQRVLVVDDSAFVRRMMTDWIEGEPDLEVAGVAKNGHEAIEFAATLKPDVVTLDIEMPLKSGLDALPEIMRICPRVLMVSNITIAGAQATLQALEAGAYDFVTKPNNEASLGFLNAKDETLEKIRAARYCTGRVPSISIHAAAIPKSASGTDTVVLIATSTGGPSALRSLWEGLPKDFPAPILLVQHMPQGFTSSLAKRLEATGTVPCEEATHGTLIEPGRAYLAPGGIHMSIENGNKIVLLDSQKVNNVKPAADILFEAAARQLGNRCLGVILTGMGRDGAAGCLAIRKAGGKVIGEDEDSCVIYGMPKAAKEIGGIDIEVTLPKIPSAIVASLARRQALAS